MNNDDKMFAMLEKIYVELQATNIELSDFKKETNAQFDQVNNRIDQMDNRINQIDNKIDNEVITRLDRLDSNQESIKRFILNSDDTFKKSEEAYDVIQKFREVFAE